MQHVKRLILEERCRIAILLSEGYLKLAISTRLNRDRTTITRELRRNSIYGSYCANSANDLASERQLNTHIVVTFTSEIRDLVEDYIYQDWSPVVVSLSKRIYSEMYIAEAVALAT